MDNVLREKVNQSELLYVHDQPKKAYWAAKSTTGKKRLCLDWLQSEN